MEKCNYRFVVKDGLNAKCLAKPGLVCSTLGTGLCPLRKLVEKQITREQAENVAYILKDIVGGLFNIGKQN